MRLPVHCCLLLSVLATVQADCPGAPWKEWKGHCYRLSASPVSWHSIRADCKSSFRQADVASITSKAEHNFIVKKLAGKLSVWLGMRSHKERRWWVDNSPVIFTNFKKRAPRTKEAKDVVRLEGRTGYWQFVSSYGTGIKLRGVCKMASCHCPRGWKKNNNRCYKAKKRRIGWLEARQQCQRMSPTADLVTIRSEAENNFVFGLAAGQYPSWIGLNDREQEGEYRWSGGGRLSYKRLHPLAEPNGRVHGSDCVMLNKKDKKWSYTGCSASNFRNGFVCELQMCGRDKPIRLEPARGGRLRVWRPEDGVRCPDGWSRSGDKCFSKPTAADTFIGVQSLCTRQHPQAGIAIVSSLEDSDRAYHAANTLPLWIDHGVHFTNWQQDDAGSAECASMQKSGQWLSESCEKVQPGLCQVPACVPKCPWGWSLFEGHCYRVDDTNQKAVDAEATCQSAGGHLASIQSLEENDFITTLAFPSRRASEFNTDWRTRFVYIGASRADDGSVWSWNDCADWTMWRWSGRDGDGPSVTKGTCAMLNFNGRWKGFGPACVRGFPLRSVCKLDPCRKHFGPLDRSGCKSVELTTTTTTLPTTTLPTTTPYPTTLSPTTLFLTTRAATTRSPTTTLPTTTLPTTTPAPTTLSPTTLSLTTPKKSTPNSPHSVTQPVAVQPTGCPDDGRSWSKEGGVCITVSMSNPEKYWRARTICIRSSTNGYIVGLPSIRLANQKAALMKVANGSEVWVGIRRAVGNRGWNWSDGIKAESLDWQVEPGQHKSAASMDGKTGGLVAHDFEDKLPFFCEAWVSTLY